MLRWLLFIILAVWVSRLVHVGRPASRRTRPSDFHPGPGAADPSTVSEPGDESAFSSGDIVDADFEEIPGPPSP
jgi:hypothetical protein